MLSCYSFNEYPFVEQGGPRFDGRFSPINIMFLFLVNGHLKAGFNDFHHNDNYYFLSSSIRKPKREILL